MLMTNGIIVLKITEVDVADSGLYFCGMLDNYFIFTNATVLKVQDPSCEALTTLKMITLCLIFPLLVEMAGTESSPISQENGLISANVGDAVVLVCFNKVDTGVMFSWYKQTFRNVPQLISTIYKYNSNATFYHEFKDNPRFSVEGGQGKNHLMIEDVELSDSGTYYCGSSYGNNLQFGQGVILIIKGSGSRNLPVLQQPVSESVQPGDSMTLNCTIHTETCAGEHSVYWFRHGTGESHPGIIYTLGDKGDQCEKSPEAGSPTQSCVYNLPKRNLSISDAGTYYCASCGEILFGNGTKLDIEAGTHSQQSQYGNPHANTSDQQLHGDDDGLNYAALKFTDKSTKPRRQRREQREQREEETIYSGDPSLRQEVQPDSSLDTGAQDADSLHYVALNLINKKNWSTRQRSNMEEEMVYSGIRQ
ncbi:uncharacterized protein LOC121563357 [Coregonus clupeaformis]|uniref:uncharacterized protein LOC121563357 n=1 Tax=Coregonus clupeaformis TaxID=59861 RepID=UPI001E1C7D34|nr:uncharacterized protein LOC121563357 [Coregonus clupeaformis]